MAYYFAVETEENSYVGKNIKYSGYFGNECTYKNHCECSLEEIDRYTTKFNNERMLKHCLLSEGIITLFDLDKPLAIIYSEGIERRIVSKNILYKNSQKFIENPNLIIEYITNRYEENDNEFFRQLEETLPVNSIARCMIAKKATEIEKRLLGEITDGSKTISNTAKILVYDFYLCDEGELVIKDETNKESIHQIVSFINDYELRLNKNKQNIKVKIKENTSNQ